MLVSPVAGRAAGGARSGSARTLRPIAVSEFLRRAPSAVVCPSRPEASEPQDKSPPDRYGDKQYERQGETSDVVVEPEQSSQYEREDQRRDHSNDNLKPGFHRLARVPGAVRISADTEVVRGITTEFP